MSGDHGEHQHHLSRTKAWAVLVVLGTALAVLALVASVVSLVTKSRPDEAHGRFVAGKRPWDGTEWKKTKAVLYQDPDRPLTWHVCTEKKCGRYYEDSEDK